VNRGDQRRAKRVEAARAPAVAGLARCLFLLAAWAAIAACAANPVPPDAPTHRCIEIPHGFVECTPIAEHGPDSDAR
jgi:hypothetical protein